ncbi:MAG: hypothetical protein K2G21_09245 [Muribaculaceae bacterium]|nr:hypothetical protein [Muribaculaceae bacterium]
MNYTLFKRNAHFMAAVERAAAAQGKNQNLQEAIRHVINSPAPEFYVNYDTAYRNVSLAIRGKLPKTKSPTRNRQWNDIIRRVREVMSQKPDKTIGAALSEVLEHGNAPSFYLTMNTAIGLYYQLASTPLATRTTAHA